MVSAASDQLKSYAGAIDQKRLRVLLEKRLEKRCTGVNSPAGSGYYRGRKSVLQSRFLDNSYFPQSPTDISH